MEYKRDSSKGSGNRNRRKERVVKITGFGCRRKEREISQGYSAAGGKKDLVAMGSMEDVVARVVFAYTSKAREKSARIVSGRARALQHIERKEENKRTSENESGNATSRLRSRLQL